MADVWDILKKELEIMVFHFLRRKYFKS